MKPKKVLFILFIFLAAGHLRAQQARKFTVTGFLEYLNNTWAPSQTTRWTNGSGAYNRVNLQWYPVKSVEFSAGIRTNFNFGPMMADYYPYYADALLKDYGWADLTFRLAEDSSYLFYTNIDRLFLKWNYHKIEVTLGRQRINWGLNLVWNPNDIFNTYNYFDFDYVERPGSDAIRLQYYTGNFSSLQLAAKIDHNHNVTAAAMYKFNVRNYDLQLLGGVMQNDLVLGLGWDGQIKGIGFSGEASWFRHLKNFADTSGQLVASIAANYTFPNQIYLHGAVIFNSTGTTGPAGQGAFLLLGNRTPKNLTLSKFDLFAQTSYPITPLIKADISAIFNPNDHSAFVGPSMDFSLTENLDFLIMGQLFFGKPQTEFGDFGQMYYVRLKWNF